LFLISLSSKASLANWLYQLQFCWVHQSQISKKQYLC